MADNEKFDLDSIIRGLRDRNVRVSRVVEMIGAVRGRSAENRKAIDAMLVSEYRSLCISCEEMRAAYEQLKELLEKAMSPPYHPAVFLGIMETPRGDFGRVSREDGESFLEFGDTVDPRDLQRGDHVLLNETRNLIVLKVPPGERVNGSIATIARCLPDGRLVITDRDTEYVVAKAEWLADEKLQAGDSVRWSQQVMLILEKLPAADQGSRFLLEDVADTPPQSIGGLDELRDQTIRRFVLSISRPELASLYGLTKKNRRLLLEGPPGTGKTLLARIIASEIKRETGRACRLAVVSGSELYDPYVGATEANITSLLRVPPDFDGISVVFLDEIDAIGSVRGRSGNNHADRFLATLLGVLDGFDQRSDVVVITATNRRDVLDPALLERFAWITEVKRPKKSAARDIFNVHFPDSLPLSPNGAERASTHETMVELVVSRLYDPNGDNQIAVLKFRDGKTRTVFASELVSGRLLEQIAVAARESGFQRHAVGGDSGIVLGDVQKAVFECIERLAATLSVRNVHSMLTDLPKDIDVLDVEPVRRKVHGDHYLN
jgi:ATP-dependent 26S proteasome regulatory subunit